MSDEQKLLSSAEVGKLFGISTHAVRQRVARGTLPTPRRIGGRWYFNAEEIRKLING